MGNTTENTTVDHRRLHDEENAEFSAYLHTLDDAQWERPSLCEGWRVRDVVGHILYGNEMHLSTLPLRLARYGFSSDRSGKAYSIARADNLIATLLPRAREHSLQLRKRLEDFVSWEDRVFHGDTAGILQQLAGTSDCQTRRHFSVVVDAPNTDVIVQKVSARDITFQTTGVSGANDCENDPFLRIHRHQPGVFGCFA